MMITNAPASLLIQACGHLAPFASIVVFLAPVPTVRQISQSKTVGSLPLLPYSSMVASSLVWFTYGLLKSEPKVWSSNGIGLILSLYYCWEFMKFAPKKIASPTLPGTVSQHVQACLLFLVLTVSVVGYFPKAAAAGYIGSLGVVLCVAMFASPLAALKTVLATKSAKSIPLPFTLAAVTNCLMWSVVGLFDMKDANIYAPNLLGLSFGLAQVALKLKFGSGESSSVDLPL